MITQPVKDNCPCKRDQEGKCPCDPNIPIIEGAKANINNTIGLAGNALLGGSMTGEPNPAMGALGGALSGFSAGGPLGAIIGAIGGFGTAGTARSDYEKTLEDQKNRYIKDRTFLPDSAEEGGMPGTILQTELGEHLVLPSMEISKVNAKEKHKDMKKHEVTDIVPEGTIVFSAKKIFDPKKDADFELTPALSYYNDTDTFDYKAQTVGDILGDKKMTFAEAIEKVKKYYPTTDEKSLVAEETNKQNLEARKPIVDYLFLKQSGGKPKEIKGELPKASDGWPESRKHLEGVGLLEPQIMEKGGKAGNGKPNTNKDHIAELEKGRIKEKKRWAELEEQRNNIIKEDDSIKATLGKYSPSQLKRKIELKKTYDEMIKEFSGVTKRYNKIRKEQIDINNSVKKESPQKITKKLDPKKLDVKQLETKINHTTPEDIQEYDPKTNSFLKPSEQAAASSTAIVNPNKVDPPQINQTLVDPAQATPVQTDSTARTNVIPPNTPIVNPNRTNPAQIDQTLLDPKQVVQVQTDPVNEGRGAPLVNNANPNALGVVLQPNANQVPAVAPAAPPDPPLTEVQKSNKELDDLIESIRTKYSKQEETLNTRREVDKNDVDSLIRRKNSNNAFQLGNQVLFNGLQSGYSNPALESTSLIESQYKDTPGALVDQQANALAANSNSVVNALASAGVSPGEIASYAAKTTDSVVAAQSDLRSKENDRSFNNNKGKIADFRQVIQGNNQKIADQENHLTDFNNKKLASIGGYVNDYLTNKSSIADNQYTLNKKGDTDYYDALGSIDKARTQLDIAKIQNKLGQTNAIVPPAPVVPPVPGVQPVAPAYDPNTSPLQLDPSVQTKNQLTDGKDANNLNDLLARFSGLDAATKAKLLEQLKNSN